MTATAAAADLAPGDVIRYKRDGKFTVVAHVDGDRWTVRADTGKFAGKDRTVTLDANTPVVERATSEPLAPWVAPEADAEMFPMQRTVPAQDVTPDVLDAVDAEHERRNRAERAEVLAAGHDTTLVAAPKRTTKAPKRVPLPAGYVTPVGLVALINSRGLYTGGSGALRPQSIYQYIKFAPEADPFPGEQVAGRLAVRIDAGLAWWQRKNERAASRRRAG